MKINFNEIIENLYTEDRQLIKTSTSENTIIYPEQGYMIRNKRTGELIKTYVVIGGRDSIENYEEVLIPSDK